MNETTAELLEQQKISKNRPESLPGDFAIWVFIFAELLVFGVFFLAYAFARSNNLEMFNTYQLTLDSNKGAINTILLLTSSYFVVRGVTSIKADRVRSCINWLILALLSGMGFLVIKIIEFSDKFAEGISLSTNTFYMFYLSLTFFHFMHVILGMVILAAVAIKAKQGSYSSREYTGVETGASYWHMVDLVWIVLFPLVYVIR